MTTIEPILPVDLVREIVELKIDYVDTEEEKKVKTIVNGLCIEDMDVIACTMYTYWVISATQKKIEHLNETNENEPSLTSPYDVVGDLNEIRCHMASHEIVRQLRGEYGKISKAITRLQTVIDLRKELNMDLMRSCFLKQSLSYKQEDLDMEALFRERIQHEFEHGQVCAVCGCDKFSHPISYRAVRMAPVRDAITYQTMNYYCADRCFAIAEITNRGTDVLNINVSDYGGNKSSNSPPISPMVTMIRNMNVMWPERLFRYIVLDPPFIFATVWSMLCLFLATVTQEKVLMLSPKNGEKNDQIMEALFEPHAVTSSMYSHGTLDFNIDVKRYLYDIPHHEMYTPATTKE